MPIHKPVHVKDEEATATEAPEHQGRHRLLRIGSIHYEIWLFVRANPDCTREEVQKATGANWRRVTTLIDEGLIYNSGRRGPKGTLRITDGASTGRARDTLFVDLDVFVNELGEYSVRAKLHGEKPGAGENSPRLVQSKRIDIRVPRPREGYQERVTHEVGVTTIDAEFTVIEG